MNETLIQGAYIVAGLLFILALAGLSKHETAVMGNKYGIVGMAIALAATLWLATKSAGFDALGIIAVAMAIGALIGITLARKVEMTGMPELIAMLHSFVGAAAVIVGWNEAAVAEVGKAPVKIVLTQPKKWPSKASRWTTSSNPSTAYTASTARPSS